MGENYALIGRPFVKRFALCYCYRTIVLAICLSVLSVCNVLVYCGHTVGWIKMPLGTKEGLGPGRIFNVLDGSSSLTERGTVRLCGFRHTATSGLGVR